MSQDSQTARRRSPAASDAVRARVLKKGVGRISTGVHVAGQGDETFPQAAIVELAPAVAAALEDRGWVEIQ